MLSSSQLLPFHMIANAQPAGQPQRQDRPLGKQGAAVKRPATMITFKRPAISKIPIKLKDKIAAPPLFKRPAQAKVRAPSQPKTVPSGIKRAAKALLSVKKNGGVMKAKCKYEQNPRVRRPQRVSPALMAEYNDYAEYQASFGVAAESYESFARSQSAEQRNILAS
jgi:hypothetical protein